MNKNIVCISDEDKEFIQELLSLPSEKKFLIRGIIIGLVFQEEQKSNLVNEQNQIQQII